VVYGWSRVAKYSSSHLDRKLERIAMSTLNKTFRKALALAIASTLLIGLGACSSQGYGKDLNPKTSSFLFEKFKQGEYIAPYDPPRADVGATMEAMVQLSGVGYDRQKQSKAIDWLTSNTNLVNSPGLRGEYLFTAFALGFESDSTVSPILTSLKEDIDENGEIKDTNNFSYCWVILGLAASGEEKLANTVAMNLFGKSENNGGYKYTTGDISGPATADVTGFAVMGLKATEGFGSSEDEAAKTFALGRAKSWLATYAKTKNHWFGYGDVDVSGTAYGTMALKALGEPNDEYIKWLKGRINPADSGVTAPWTEPDSDTFSTLQSILPLSDLNFLDILNQLKN